MSMFMCEKGIHLSALFLKITGSEYEIIVSF